MSFVLTDYTLSGSNKHYFLTINVIFKYSLRVRDIVNTMNLGNIKSLTTFFKTVHPIQSCWLIILLISLILSILLTCCSNTDLRCCCCCSALKRLLRNVTRRSHQRGQTHDTARCRICKEWSSSTGARLATTQNQELFS